MRHRLKTFKIGRTTSHRRAMLANMTCSVFEESQIRTTVVRAKEARRMVERMITLGKRGTLHARRQAIAKLQRPDVVRTLFNDIAPSYQDRDGGYTRILRLGQRTGDGAEMCLLQLVTEPVQKSAETAPTDDVATNVAAPAAAATAETAETEEAEEAVTEEQPESDEGAEASSEEDNDAEQESKES